MKIIKKLPLVSKEKPDPVKEGLRTTNKINELISAVNHLIAERDEVKPETPCLDSGSHRTSRWENRKKR